MLVLLTGCASVVQGTDQVISIETLAPDGKLLPNASCTASNNFGSWTISTPGAIKVHRSPQNLSVVCHKAGEPPGMVSAQPTMDNVIYGNIALVCMLCTDLDLRNGAAYSYSPLISVQMGASAVVVYDDANSD